MMCSVTPKVAESIEKHKLIEWNMHPKYLLQHLKVITFIVYLDNASQPNTYKCNKKRVHVALFTGCSILKLWFIEKKAMDVHQIYKSATSL